MQSSDSSYEIKERQLKWTNGGSYSNSFTWNLPLMKKWMKKVHELESRSLHEFYVDFFSNACCYEKHGHYAFHTPSTLSTDSF